MQTEFPLRVFLSITTGYQTSEISETKKLLEHILGVRLSIDQVNAKKSLVKRYIEILYPEISSKSLCLDIKELELSLEKSLFRHNQIDLFVREVQRQVNWKSHPIEPMKILQPN